MRLHRFFLLCYEVNYVIQYETKIYLKRFKRWSKVNLGRFVCSENTVSSVWFIAPQLHGLIS